MADQLRKVQQDAYYNVFKSMAITDWALPMLARLPSRAPQPRRASRCSSCVEPGPDVVMRALRCCDAAQEREKFLGTLRTGLHISAEQHAAILGRLEQDDSVNRIRHAVSWVPPAALRAGAAARALRAALKTCH
jgi:hypothetical protein